MTSYNPYDHREINSKSTSNVEVVIHLVKSSFGIGVLSLPFAITRSGYIMAIIIGIPVIFIVIYGIHVLIRTMVKVSSQLQQPYTPFEVCIQTVVSQGPPHLQKTSNCAKYTVRVLLIAYPLGICSAYIIFMAHSLNQLYSICKEEHLSIYAYEAILIIPVFLINCIPNLHKMVIFSAIADLLTFTCFMALYYYIFGEEPIVNGKHEMIGSDVLQIPLFLGTVLFALEAISVIMAIEERMKKPQDFHFLYNISMCIVIAIYCFTGISGYIKYGDNLKPSINLNLPDTWVSKGFQCLFITIIFLSYPIQCYPVTNILWDRLLAPKVESNKKKILYEYLFRFGITLFTVIMAMIIPKFEVMVTLVGAVCISTLGIFLPGYLEYLYIWSYKVEATIFTKIRDWVMMISGVTILIIVVIMTIVFDIISTVNKYSDLDSMKGLYGLYSINMTEM